MSSPTYTAMTEAQLVALARQDAQSGAMAELHRRITPMILSKATHFAQTEQDIQDFFQEGMIGFLAAVRTFKEDCNTAFTTYAFTCAANRMKNLLKQRSKDSRLDVVFFEDDNLIEDYSNNPESTLQNADEIEAFAKCISDRLSPYEKQVLHLYLCGKTYSAIAQALKTNEKSVDNCLQRIRKKLAN